MAEEFKKYKDILARECEEFKEEMEREVSALLPFQLINEKWNFEAGVVRLCNEFSKISLLIFMVCSLHCNLWILLYCLDPGPSGYKVALAL